VPEAPSAATTGGGAAGPDLREHRLGEHDAGRPGPLFLFTGGLHGNEPGGVRALLDLLVELRAEAPAFAGRLVCLAGNLDALRAGQRYLDADLNRLWGEPGRARAASPGPAPRELAVRDRLAGELEAELGRSRGPVIFLDLHSTSGAGAPFSIIGDSLQNRRVALALPVPVILGLEENVDGALLGEFGERGHVAVGFEGGQHEAPTTRSHLLAAAWITLAAGGAFPEGEPLPVQRSRELLAAATRGLPPVVETRYRHHVEVREAFTMRPGFENFSPVERGAVLADHDGAEVLAEEDGRVLLPLYQGQGQDGFFLARDVRPFWLAVSAALRRLGAPRLLPLLPGVRATAGDRSRLEVDRRLARWWVREVFHLCGFRQLESRGAVARFLRRVEGPPGRA
jgi:succinylglutamate desuccinylase